ncbi:MAG: DUF2917 domain-containing protein [Polyangiaceae bacterium]|nr:DUF2917 domain-containing protein [Polyangiaceae bacterium]
MRETPRIRSCNPTAVSRPTQQGERVELARRSLTSRRLDGAAIQVRCDRGSLWVTLDGELDDVVLSAGQCAVFAGRGLVLIEALETATAVLTADAA